jgi:outer membrane protein assembly complex protein YaeT
MAAFFRTFRVPVWTALCLIVCSQPLWAANLQSLKPGVTYEVDKIVFTGNQAFSASQLLNVMQTRERPFYQLWKKRHVFDPDVFTQDLKELEVFYHSHGYFRAAITYHLKIHDGLVTPQIKIKENKPAKTQRIEIVLDRQQLPRSDPLFKKIRLKPGDLFNDTAYADAENALATFFRNGGFAHTKTQRRAEVNITDNEVRVWYYVQPGSPGVFGHTTVTGLKTIRPYIVTRELTYHPGEPFSQTRLDQTRDRLLKLRLFSVVRLTPLSNVEDPRIVPIRLTVRERPKHSIAVGGGYNTESQFILNFAWSDMNWLGGGRQVTAFLRYSNIDSAARVVLTQPYLFNQRAFTGIFGFGEDIQQVPPYTLFGTRFTPSIRYNFSEKTKAFVGYRLEYDKLTSVDSQLVAALGGIKMSGIVSGPEAGFTMDTTNDLFNPSRGYVIDLEGMQAGEIFGGSFNFYRFWGQLKYYHLLGWKTILATRLKLGFGDYFGHNPENYPLFYRFFIGGEGSVRGWRYWELGPHTPDDTPIGGLTDLEGSIEFRRPIWGNLSGAAFLDFGQLSTHAYDVPIRDLDFGAGPALSYNTPVGPIRIDIGIPFHKPRNQYQWQFYFSIGQYF